MPGGVAPPPPPFARAQGRCGAWGGRWHGLEATAAHLLWPLTTSQSSCGLTVAISATVCLRGAGRGAWRVITPASPAPGRARLRQAPGRRLSPAGSWLGSLRRQRGGGETTVATKRGRQRQPSGPVEAQAPEAAFQAQPRQWRACNGVRRPLPTSGGGAGPQRGAAAPPPRPLRFTSRCTSPSALASKAAGSCAPLVAPLVGSHTLYSQGQGPSLDHVKIQPVSGSLSRVTRGLLEAWRIGWCSQWGHQLWTGERRTKAAHAHNRGIEKSAQAAALVQA